MALDKILIGVINSDADIEMLLGKYCYRVPVLNCPHTEFSYIAFYQTRKCSQQSIIKYYGEITSVEKRLRVDIMGADGNERDAREYFLFHFNHISTLKTPISNRNKMRVSFIISDIDTFLNARDLMDIFDVPDLEGMVQTWLDQMGIAYKREYTFVCKSGKRYRFDFAVSAEKYLIDIECDSRKYHSGKKQQLSDIQRDNEIGENGWHVMRLSEWAIMNNPSHCMEQLRILIK